MPCKHLNPAQAGKVALELRKAKHADIRASLQWAFGDLMKQARTKEEAAEALEMLNSALCYSMPAISPCCKFSGGN